MSGAFEFLGQLRLVVVGTLTVGLALIASGHAIIYKRDSRAAVAWVGLIWLVPILGAVLYALLGVNRIKRHATLVRTPGHRMSQPTPVWLGAGEVLGDLLDDRAAHLVALATLVDEVTRRPLSVGNGVKALANGDETYPAMLEAIEGATESVALSTYIFDNDPTGRQFSDALERATRRGVRVRVLIDSFGARYTFPSMVRVMRRRGVRVARFMPTYVPWRAMFWNLRNHRKILVVDGRQGFSGGINIRHGHVLQGNTKSPVQDLHFAVQGPVVRHFMEAFAEDWVFTTGERLEGPEWFPDLEPGGGIAARGITDGPDEDFEKLRWTIQGAIATARQTVRIITPYFVPDATLVSALNVAAMRGVEIDIVIPQKNNLPVVAWASHAMLWQLVKRGCDVYYSPPPFDHTKLAIVDGTWTLFGSGNWDARSLRLNFEFNVECYDRAFAQEMEQLFLAKRDAGRPITAEELDNRALPVKLRDGIARLMSPYL